MSHQMLSTKITRYNTTRNFSWFGAAQLKKFTCISTTGHGYRNSFPVCLAVVRCPLAIVYINLEPGAMSDTLSGVLAGLLNTNTKPKVFWARNRSGMKPKTFCNYFFLRVECQVFGLGRYERSFEKQTTRQRNRLKYKKYNNNNNNKLKNCLSYVLMMAL